MDILVGWILFDKKTNNVVKEKRRLYKSKPLANVALTYRKNKNSYCILPVYVIERDVPQKPIT